MEPLIGVSDNKLAPISPTNTGVSKIYSEPKQFWLVTYSQSECMLQFPAVSVVISEHPAEFLVKCLEEYPELKTAIHFAMEIAKEHFETLAKRGA